jgi:hypothetical protein
MRDILEWFAIFLILVAVVGGWWRVLDWVKEVIAMVRKRLKS